MKLETKPDIGILTEAIISSNVRMAINHAEAMERRGDKGQAEQAKREAYNWINFQCGVAQDKLEAKEEK